MRYIVGAIWISLCLLHEATAAQPPESTSCRADPAQLEANKKRVLEFFSFNGPPQERARRFLAEDYIQHNPRLLRMDEITGASGRAAWLLGFQEATRRGTQLTDMSGVQIDKPVVLMAECDLVTAMFPTVLEDPDRPGQRYEAFTFETFRIRDGMLAEHWDQVRLEKDWMAGATETAPAKR